MHSATYGAAHSYFSSVKHHLCCCEVGKYLICGTHATLFSIAALNQY